MSTESELSTAVLHSYAIIDQQRIKNNSSRHLLLPLKDICHRNPREVLHLLVRCPSEWAGLPPVYTIEGY